MGVCVKRGDFLDGRTPSLTPLILFCSFILWVNNVGQLGFTPELICNKVPLYGNVFH
jgi:hypothetical protein